MDVRAGFDIAGFDFSGTGRFQGYSLRPFGGHPDIQGFDIQHNIRDILADPRNGGKFVQNTFNLNRCDCRPLQRRQQNPAQRISQRQAEAPFQRFRYDDGRTHSIGARLHIQF